MKAALLELSCWSKIGFPAVPVLTAAPFRPSFSGWLIRTPWSEKKFVAGVAGNESRIPEIEGAANSEKLFAVPVMRDPPLPYCDLCSFLYFSAIRFTPGFRLS